jgi:hypothetical protein
MLSYKKAQNVVDMIENELNGGYAYTSFEAMCKEYNVTPQEYSEFLGFGLRMVEILEEGKTSEQEVKTFVECKSREA